MPVSELTPAIIDIARAAGQEILAVYNAEDRPEVSVKEDNSPLTDADRRAHRLICDRLRELTPDIPVLSEESDQEEASVRLSWPRLWIVDPLDGTKEFINRNGEFTVNIALVDAGEPVLGVVHVPVTGVTYSGVRDEGAAYLSATEQRPIQATRLTAGKPLRVVASRSHRGPLVDALLESLKSQFEHVELVSMGSSLKICLLAAGEADLYPRLAPTSEWDTAAAHAVLRAAGGEIVDTQFRPLRYNQRESLLNPHFIGLADTTFDWGSSLDSLND
jgi:3'(2'), 5'-bisphosphate nucleotidase